MSPWQRPAEPSLGCPGDMPLACPGAFLLLLYSNGEIDWRILNRTPLYSNESERKGWCHATPEEIMGGRAQTTCKCMYDGAEGMACEQTVEAYCINQCSERGTCINSGFCQVLCSLYFTGPGAVGPGHTGRCGGLWGQRRGFCSCSGATAGDRAIACLPMWFMCQQKRKEPLELVTLPADLGLLWVCFGFQCDKGWYGIDCSIPTASQALKMLPVEGGAGNGDTAEPDALLPAWLQGGAQGGCPAAEAEGDRPEMARQGHRTVLRGKVRRKPLVYVYDMPPDFTMKQLQVGPTREQGQALTQLRGLDEAPHMVSWGLGEAAVRCTDIQNTVVKVARCTQVSLQTIGCTFVLVVVLQARTWKGQCVRRLYGGANETRYQFGQLYGAEVHSLQGPGPPARHTTGCSE